MSRVIETDQYKLDFSDKTLVVKEGVTVISSKFIDEIYNEHKGLPILDKITIYLPVSLKRIDNEAFVRMRK